VAIKHSLWLDNKRMTHVHVYCWLFKNKGILGLTVSTR